LPQNGQILQWRPPLPLHATVSCISAEWVHQGVSQKKLSPKTRDTSTPMIFKAVLFTSSRVPSGLSSAGELKNLVENGPEFCLGLPKIIPHPLALSDILIAAYDCLFSLVLNRRDKL